MTINKYFGRACVLVAAASLALASCTDKVGDNEFNISTGGDFQTVADVETATGLLRAGMRLMHDDRVHKYQYQFNLHIDNYAGYLVVANKLQGRLPRTYSPNANFESGPNANMLWVARQVVPVMNSAEKLGRPELGAIAAIMFDFMASEYVDVHGPMPYNAYRVLQSEPPVVYQPVSEVYKLILTDLKKQQEILKGITLTPDQQNELARFDQIAEGQLTNWIAFANALRMRMAMRMVKVEPELAKAEFESAVADQPQPLQTSIKLKDVGRHPLYTMSEDWDDTRLNASFQNLLERFNHPALAIWFTQLDGEFKDMNGEVSVPAGQQVYAGMRPGMATYAKEETIFSNSYKRFSRINSSYSNKPIYIFKNSEVQFLLAEAAVRGWNTNGVTAISGYGQGLRMFFAEEGLSAQFQDYYKQKAEDTPRDKYVDYWNSANNSPEAENGSEELGVTWRNDLSDEKKLEMIITQKYICNYPLSLESWSEMRRTGYPKLIGIHPEDSGDGSIPPAGWSNPNGLTPSRLIRRIPFVKSGSVALNDILTTALPALKAEDKSMFGGQDLQATHLWWDVPGKGNF